jgi:hypothetical protein
MTKRTETRTKGGERRRQERHRVTVELPRATWARLKVRAAEESARVGRFVSMGEVAARAVVAAAQGSAQ